MKSTILAGDHFSTVEVPSWKRGVPGHQTSAVSFMASPGRETKELTVSLGKPWGWKWEEDPSGPQGSIIPVPPQTDLQWQEGAPR